MAEGLRVGPKHRADTSDGALEAAREWLELHRPVEGHTGVGGYHRSRYPYTIHVKPDVQHKGRWVATIEAVWTPTPQTRSRAS